MERNGRSQKLDRNKHDYHRGESTDIDTMGDVGGGKYGKVDTT